MKQRGVLIRKKMKAKIITLCGCSSIVTLVDRNHMPKLSIPIPGKPRVGIDNYNQSSPSLKHRSFCYISNEIFEGKEIPVYFEEAE